MRESDAIDHAVGIELLVQAGQKVQQGEELAIVTASTPEKSALLAESVADMLKTTTAPMQEEPSAIIDIWK